MMRLSTFRCQCGLSSSCETAIMLSTDYDGKVQVVNNQRISVTQRQSVLDALKLRDAGKNAAEIKEILEKVKLESSIYITVDTLKYLKKGGRITPAAAAIGTVLNLKPVLQIQGEKLDAYAKFADGSRRRRRCWTPLRRDMLHRFGKSGPVHLEAAYTCSEEEARKWKEEIEDRFPEYEVDMIRFLLALPVILGREQWQ